MLKIDWDEYKVYKQQRADLKALDNFETLLEFLRSFYNKNSPFEVYDILSADEVGRMMLDKRHIKRVEDLENYIFKKLAR